jgi:hypothetical protein
MIVWRTLLVAQAFVQQVRLIASDFTILFSAAVTGVTGLV